MSAKAPTPPREIPVTSAICGLKYLSMAGGGRKGSAYISAVEALEEPFVLEGAPEGSASKCVLDQIDEVAGSSAGGLMATALAVGCRGAQVRKLMQIDFRTLQDKAELGWMEASHMKDFFSGISKGVEAGRDVARVQIERLKQVPLIGRLVKSAASVAGGIVGGAIKAEVAVFSALEKAEDASSLVLGSGLGLWEGDALTDLLAKMLVEQNLSPNITFQELATLAEVPGSPFKKLTLTGSNVTTGKLQYFNAENTPNMPIVLAARISVSFPGGYKPVIVNGEVWVDGGLLENLPDVYNKEPYISRDGQNASGGNPRALALSLQTPEKAAAEAAEKTAKEEGRVREHNNQGVKAFALANVGALTSTRHLQAKYGDNLVKVSTKGVGTLEFDLTPERDAELVASGGEAIEKTFNSMLEKEKKEKKDREQDKREPEYYAALSDAELIRIIVHSKKWRLFSQDPNDANFIREFEKRKKVSPEKKRELEALYEDEQAFLNRKEPQELPESTLDPKSVDAQQVAALSKMIVDGIERREQARHELENTLAEFKLIKAALTVNQTEIARTFEESPDFSHFLEALQAQDTTILEALKLHAPDSPEILALEQQRAALYQSAIEKYAVDQPLISDFFKDLQEDNNKPGFKVPTNQKDLIDYCKQDITMCENFIQEMEDEIEKANEEIQSFKKVSAISQKAELSVAFLALQELKANLNDSVARNTTVVTKLNHFLTEKSPKLRRVVTPFLKLVAFSTFLCALPVGIPISLVAKGVEKFSKNPNAQETAKRMLDFFKMSNIDQDVKLRELRTFTVECMKKMRNDYETMDNTEATYLHKLHAQYLEGSGVNLEDIFAKKSTESDAAYQQRIQEKAKQLGMQVPTQTDQIAEQFRNTVQSEVDLEFNPRVAQEEKKKAALIGKLGLINIEDARHHKDDKHLNFHQAQLRSKSFDMLHNLDMKMKKNEPLNREEVEIYIEESKKVHKELPKKFLEINKAILEQIKQEGKLNETVPKLSPQEAHLISKQQHMLLRHKQKTKQGGDDGSGKMPPPKPHQPP